MPASEHLQPFQMRLFMQAKELMDVAAGDHPEEKSMSQDHELANRKLARSKKYPRTGNTLYEDIKKRGVQRPVSLWLGKGEDSWEQAIINGHHRVAASNDIDPEMFIPVIYLRSSK